MENYIIESKDSFTNDFCDEIINTFNINNIEQINDNRQKYYKTKLNKNNTKLKNIKYIEDTLFEVLNKNIEKYDIKRELLLFNEYDFLKFEKNEGYVSYLNDFKIIKNLYSFLNFIIFLNDVEEEGYLEIIGNYKIKPEKGKLIVFPSGWCFPYCHQIPISNDKYILFGNIYIEF